MLCERQLTKRHIDGAQHISVFVIHRPASRCRALSSHDRTARALVHERSVLRCIAVAGAEHAFFDWERRGFGALARGESVRVVLDLGAASTVEKHVATYQAGDITALDRSAIARTCPRDGTHDFEPNLFPMIELRDAALPWLASPDGSRLLPWIVLIAVEERAGVRLATTDRGTRARSRRGSDIDRGTADASGAILDCGHSVASTPASSGRSARSIIGRRVSLDSAPHARVDDTAARCHAPVRSAGRSEVAAMKYVLIALPCLLGNQPAPCPPQRADDVVFEATVVSVEPPTYQCSVSDHATDEGPRCISIWTGACDVTLRVADGTVRTATATAGLGVGWCDVPAGSHAVAVCTPNGPLDCRFDLPATSGETSIVVRETPRRLHVRADNPVPGFGTELVLATHDVDLEVGSHRQFVVHANHGTPPGISSCDVKDVVSRPPPSHGCAHCNAGDPEGFYVAFVTLVLLARRRRRSA